VVSACGGRAAFSAWAVRSSANPLPLPLRHIWSILKRRDTFEEMSVDEDVAPTNLAQDYTLVGIVEGPYIAPARVAVPAK
jgi:hypothetical protein